jgi:metacaspase-1
MSKLALLIGINYVGTSAQLNGCINDINNTKDVLKSVYNYTDNNIVCLTDETDNKPTYNNIINALDELSKRSNSEDVKEIWISYSGHGTYVRDDNNDEDDRRDECLVPLDYQLNGLVKDDFLNNILSSINPNVNVIVVIDACHSETMLDLPYRYISGVKNVIENKYNKVKANCVMISGCRDNQVSMDAYNLNNSREYSGAMTTSLLNILKANNYNISCFRLLQGMRYFLKKRKFKQVPQITCTKKLNKSSMFSVINNSFISN